MFLKILKKNFVYLLLFIIFASFTNFFTNIYSLYKRKYDERLIRTYGQCQNLSYGYIKKIYNQYFFKEKKVYIINFEVFPESYSLFPNLKKDESISNLILLNYKKNYESKLKKKIDISKYQLIDVEDKCFFYKKK